MVGQHNSKYVTGPLAQTASRRHRNTITCTDDVITISLGGHYARERPRSSWRTDDVHAFRVGVRGRRRRRTVQKHDDVNDDDYIESDVFRTVPNVIMTLFYRASGPVLGVWRRNTMWGHQINEVVVRQTIMISPIECNPTVFNEQFFVGRRHYDFVMF